jgi:hypothetical protein
LEKFRLQRSPPSPTIIIIIIIIIDVTLEKWCTSETVFNPHLAAKEENA